MKNKTVIYDELLETISAMPVIDCHEHLMPEKLRTETEIDFFSIILTHYTKSDLISAGMSLSNISFLQNPENDFNEKIQIFMPYWCRTSNTNYSHAIKIAVRDLYGIEDINPHTLVEINKEMIAKNKPGLYKDILQDKLNINYCVWDQNWEQDPIADNFFKLAIRLDDIIFMNSKNDITKLEKEFNMEISSPRDFEEIMEARITNNKNKGLIALKSGLAYNRTLLFEPVSRTEASLALEKVLAGHYTNNDTKILQDYLMYSLAEKAYWHDLPFQIHTGHLEGNSNIISQANPSHLSELIRNNPNTRFDLFHGGYPYGGELSSMAKIFPNVYLDMAWVHIISIEYSRRYLKEWLDTVPICKILGFGGDYIFVEGVYGHLKIALSNIAHALSDKVLENLITINEAKEYAKMMLFTNPQELYKSSY